MINRHFLSKIKHKTRKRSSSWVKLPLVKLQPATFNIKIPSYVPFTGKLTKNIVKFCRTAHRSCYCQRKTKISL